MLSPTSKKIKRAKTVNPQRQNFLNFSIGKRKLAINWDELMVDMEEFKKDLTEYKIELSEVQQDNYIAEFDSVEEKADLTKRFGDFLDRMNSMPIIDGYEGQIIVCVSHAMFLKQAKLITVTRNNIENPIKVPYKYGTVSCLKFPESGVWDMVIDGASTHFEKRGLDRYDTYNCKDFVPKEGDPGSPYIKKRMPLPAPEEFLDSPALVMTR
jgi:broad specificity phosphatase PhoE